MKLDPAGQAVVYATYLGNSGTAGSVCGGQVPQQINPINIHPTGFAIAIDSVGNAYVTGQAEPGLPATPGSPDLGTKVVGLYGWGNLLQGPGAFLLVNTLSFPVSPRGF